MLTSAKYLHHMTNNDKGSRGTLGPKVKTTSEKSHKELLWMQEIPGNSIIKATTWKLTKRSN